MRSAFDYAVSSTASESRVSTGTFVIVFCSFCINDLLFYDMIEFLSNGTISGSSGHRLSDLSDNRSEESGC